MGFIKQITDLGRVSARKQGWDDERREFQKWFVIGVLASSSCTTAVFAFKFRGF